MPVWTCNGYGLETGTYAYPAHIFRTDAADLVPHAVDLVKHDRSEEVLHADSTVVTSLCGLPSCATQG